MEDGDEIAEPPIKARGKGENTVVTKAALKAAKKDSAILAW